MKTLLLQLGLIFTEILSPFPVHAFSASSPRILVVGSTGFLGGQIVRTLDELQIDYKTASKSGKDQDYQIDLESDDAVDQMAKICKGCDAVISCVGSIGDPNDERINASNGQAAIGAKKAGVKRFVFIGNEPRIRDFSKGFLKAYVAGKEQAEAIIRQQFPNSYCIVQPNFIYGGEDFSLNPPRIPSKLGQAAEDILGLYPFQAASNALPGVFGLALGAPVSRERVAAAAVNAALGLVDMAELASRDDIIMAASKRFKRKAGNKSVNQVKQAVYDLGDCQGDKECLTQAFDYLEQIEALARRKPAHDPLLNGRWDFNFDIEADMGTGVVKDILEGRSPIKPLFNLEDLYLTISDNQSKVTITVSTKVLGLPTEIILRTNIIPEESDPTGTLFQEHFEGIELMGMKLPIPDSWQQSRLLEFTYLDETMLIARGNGGEPHFLERKTQKQAQESKEQLQTQES